MQINFKLWIENDGGELIIGEGILKLLSIIKQKGSISKAAEELNMSYRTAWGKLKKLESRLGCELIEKRAGGKDGGGTILTVDGEELLEKYNSLYQKTETFVQEQFDQLFKTSYSGIAECEASNNNDEG